MWSRSKYGAPRSHTFAGRGSVATSGAQDRAPLARVGRYADAVGAVRSARPNHRWLDVVAVAVVAALGGLLFGGWVLFQQHQKDDAAKEALDAAQNYVLKLTNLDSEAVDARFADIMDGSTGEFNDSYRKSSQQFRKELVERQVHTRGSVVAAAVKSATPDKVVVLMFVDESISNRDNSRSQLDHVRIKMTMVKLNGRWMARKVQLL
ncbi:hypothetical protein LAUMK4_03549 [Mycobacterium persicum]|uniref:Mce protein n=1 Tax=Mycobacterium persicum TaxID=1487726 RepID=A0ABY6RL36_9MYCO|nr:hypothetical protein LAUMK15_03950 [Mycobacterium persicum]VAZ96578.1 hypothetical protein LAUMK4_03549 [Mycobacterium persicum]